MMGERRDYAGDPELLHGKQDACLVNDGVKEEGLEAELDFSVAATEKSARARLSSGSWIGTRSGLISKPLVGTPQLHAQLPEVDRRGVVDRQRRACLDVLDDGGRLHRTCLRISSLA